MSNTDIHPETAAYGALILRVSLGLMYLAHSALLKVMTFGMAGTVGYFESLGLPCFTAWLTVAAEVTGGTMLILGVRTRLVALALMPVLLGALWVHSGNGWVFSVEGGGWEYPVFLLAASAVQALLGDGAYALRLPGRRKLVAA